MRIGLGGAIVVDPVRASPAAAEDEMVLDLLHERLTRLDADGRIQPDLALRWTTDAAFRTWRFALDPAASFASGRQITAADVVASLTHLLSAGDTSLAALRLEVVQGFRGFVDGTAAGVSGLQAVDTTTVQVTLDTALAQLPQVLAAPAYGIVDVTSLTAGANGDLRGLDLSGHWKVASASTGRLVLDRRSGAAGHLHSVDLRSFADPSTAYARFRNGDVDWAPVPSDQLGAAEKAYGTGHITPFHAELALGLRVPTLPTLAFRQAIAAAIDRPAIVAAVYADLADPLTSIVPAGVVGHDSGRCPTCDHSVARARALVAQAYPSGGVPPVEITVDASPAEEAMAKIVAANLSEAGIPSTVHPLVLADYQRFLLTGAQQLFTLSWIGADRTPDAYLEPLFRSGSPDNLVGLQSPAIDALLSAARGTADPALSASSWAQAEQRLLDAAVVVPIAQFRTQVVVAKGVTGLVHAVDGTVDWSAVSLAHPA